MAKIGLTVVDQLRGLACVLQGLVVHERVVVEGQKDKLIKLTVEGMGADPNAEKE